MEAPNLKSVASCVTLWIALLSTNAILAQSAIDEALKPKLPISEALRLAQQELERQGLAGKHVISTIVYHSGVVESNAPHYEVYFAPPVMREVPPASTNASAVSAATSSISFHVAMDGKITETVGGGSRASLRRRIMRQRTDVEQTMTNRLDSASTNAARTSLRRRILRQNSDTTNYPANEISVPTPKPLPAPQ